MRSDAYPSRNTPTDLPDEAIKFHRPAIAGYRYLCLLAGIDPAWVDAFPTVAWRRWMGVILSTREIAEAKVGPHLVQKAYRADPATLLNVLRRILVKDSHHVECSGVIRRMALCWDSQLGKYLLDLAKSEELKPLHLGYILDELVERDVVGATELATSILALNAHQDELARRRAQAAAHALILHACDAGWSAIWPVLTTNPVFGKEVFLIIARSFYYRHERNWGEKLKEMEVADLYLWLSEQFAELVGAGGASVGEAADQFNEISELLSALLNNLAARRTPEAVEAVRRIENVLPEHERTWALLATREGMIQGSWIPRDPPEIIALRHMPGRGVHSSKEPLEVFISYSDEDEELKNQLLKQFSVFERCHKVRVWTRDEIDPGDDEMDKLNTALDRADTALLLVSPSFRSSPFINDDQMAKIKERHVHGSLNVILIILSPYSWRHDPLLESFDPFPENGEPISQYSDNDRANVLRQIVETVCVRTPSRQRTDKVE